MKERNELATRLSLSQRSAIEFQASREDGWLARRKKGLHFIAAESKQFTHTQAGNAGLLRSRMVLNPVDRNAQPIRHVPRLQESFQ